jgi:signal transduction histidine kinase/CheY-like chemotaxis protein
LTPIRRSVAPTISDASAARDRLAEIDAHFEVAVFSVAAALAAAFLTMLVMAWAGALQLESALVWLTAMAAMGAVHIAASLIYNARPALHADWRPWAAFTSAITLCEGVGWGLAPFAVPNAGDTSAMFLVMLVTLCVSAGSVIGYGRYLPTRVIAFVTPTLPYLAFSALSPDRIVRGGFLLILLFLGAIGHLGLTADRGFRREAAMRRRNARLAVDLRRQKEAAERANVAKSRFLAAASHDLRQPIHALGLYVGALRNAALTGELRTLANRMEGSIAAMDRLFAAILDLSRLDAGVVEVHVETFPVDELIEAVCDDFREEARQKGLSLIGEPSGLILRSDPVLVERILRNFVSNATHYTQSGGVRVRCRARGDAASLQVWDSGHGVARAAIPHIFEEYVQLSNPERDRAKGLGLGLAIVRRLAALLGAKLDVASRVGRGSCFAVRIPLGAARDLVRAQAGAEAPLETSHGLVAVVEDDAAVRDAMRAALAIWGLEAVDAASGAAALAQLEARGAPPDLLLCDFRLPGGEDGLQVVAQFRARWGAALPAIMITGDTAPERLAEAHASGVVLLHKPVVYGKLRAAVGELLTRRAAAPAPSYADASTDRM